MVVRVQSVFLPLDASKLNMARRVQVMWDTDETHILTKKPQTSIVILSDDFDANNDVECAPQELYGGHIDRFWSDHAHGLELDFGWDGGGWMEILEGGCESESAREIRV